MAEATPADHAPSGHAGQSGSSEAQPPSCLASIPGFSSFEPVPLGSSSCPHVPQCPNIYDSPWQVRGWREESVNIPPPAHRPITLRAQAGLALARGRHARCPTHSPARPWCSSAHGTGAVGRQPRRTCQLLSSLEHLGHGQQRHHRPFEGREHQLTNIHQAPATGQTHNLITNQERSRPLRS